MRSRVLMLAANLVYTFLDVRAADWALGSALYKGPGSLAPVVVGALTLTLWLRLNLIRERAAAPAAATARDAPGEFRRR